MPGLVRPVPVVMPGIGPQHGPQMALAVDQHPVRHAAGKRFSDVYSNRSTFPAIAAALNAAGPQAMFHRHVRLWLADWSLSRAQAARLLGTRLAGHKIVAVQWASPSSNPDTPLPRSSLTLRQANCDLSVTLDYWHRHRR
jgi:hypothetical protein